MKDGRVSQLQPMSISVQSDCTSSANTVSKEMESTKDDVSNENPPDCAPKNGSEQDVNKSKTIQHLLSDWRTAYNKSREVKLLDLSFLNI